MYTPIMPITLRSCSWLYGLFYNLGALPSHPLSTGHVRACDFRRKSLPRTTDSCWDHQLLFRTQQPGEFTNDVVNMLFWWTLNLTYNGNTTHSATVLWYISIFFRWSSATRVTASTWHVVSCTVVTSYRKMSTLPSQRSKQKEAFSSLIGVLLGSRYLPTGKLPNLPPSNM